MFVCSFSHPLTGRAFNSSPSLSKLHVVNIPAHLNSMSALSSHFEKFGEVVNIQVLKDTGRAFVQYNTHEQAQVNSTHNAQLLSVLTGNTNACAEAQTRGLNSCPSTIRL